MKQRRFALAGITALMLCGIAIWWMTSSENAAETDGRTASSRQVVHTSVGDLQPQGAAGAQTRAAFRAAGDPFLTPELRHTLEAILFKAGNGAAADPATLKKRAYALLPEFFPAEYAARAMALTDRYVDYRVALGNIRQPSDPGDPRALRVALDARQQVRERHFTGEEYEALFAEDQHLDRYTLARLEIERNSALSAAQKQAALTDAEGSLSEAQRTQRRQAIAQVEVAAQTAAFDAKSVNDVDRFNQRSASYGEVAATQLAQLDREDRDWQTRLDDYAGAVAKKAGPAELQKLRQRLFSEQEQLRVDAALASRP